MAASNDRAVAAQAKEPTTTSTKIDKALNNDTVREYLKDNGDFLQRNPDMLDYMHISHSTGSAVSLVEKQVSVLRERNMDMRHRLNTLTANARQNDKLYEQTRALVLELMAADSVQALYSIFTEAMVKEFDVEHASMILYGEDTDSKECRIETPEKAKLAIGSLFKGNKSISGTLRKEELSFLFPESGDVGSASIMPLSSTEQLGLIAVGSSDANRYNSSVGTLFLAHIAEVIARLLPRLQAKAD
jgi:uncharacterized protein YigA (DUF484 family)